MFVRCVFIDAVLLLYIFTTALLGLLSSVFCFSGPWGTFPAQTKALSASTRYTPLLTGPALEDRRQRRTDWGSSGSFGWVVRRRWRYKWRPANSWWVWGLLRLSLGRKVGFNNIKLRAYHINYYFFESSNLHNFYLNNFCKIIKTRS